RGAVQVEQWTEGDNLKKQVDKKHRKLAVQCTPVHGEGRHGLKGGMGNPQNVADELVFGVHQARPLRRRTPLYSYRYCFPIKTLAGFVRWSMDQSNLR